MHACPSIMFVSSVMSYFLCLNCGFVQTLLATDSCVNKRLSVDSSRSYVPVLAERGFLAGHVDDSSTPAIQCMRLNQAVEQSKVSVLDY